jgi:hypothetical protein
VVGAVGCARSGSAAIKGREKEAMRIARQAAKRRPVEGRRGAELAR